MQPASFYLCLVNFSSSFLFYEVYCTQADLANFTMFTAWKWLGLNDSQEKKRDVGMIIKFKKVFIFQYNEIIKLPLNLDFMVTM